MPTTEEIKQAVRLFTGQDGYSWFVVGETKIGVHCELQRKLGEGWKNFFSRKRKAIKFKFDSLEEHLLNIIGVLLSMDDVSAVNRDEIGHRSDDSTLVRAREEEYGSRGHLFSLP